MLKISLRTCEFESAPGYHQKDFQQDGFSLSKALAGLASDTVENSKLKCWDNEEQNIGKMEQFVVPTPFK